MARAKTTQRYEVLLDGRYNDDQEVIEYLEKSKNKSGEIRAALADYVRGLRYARQQQYINQLETRAATLERDLDVLRRVVERLTSPDSK